MCLTLSLTLPVPAAGPLSPRGPRIESYHSPQPGAIDYALLAAVKTGHMSRLREKECFDRISDLPRRRNMRMGWQQWRGAYHDRQQLRHAVQAMLKSGLVRALRTWRENVDEILNQTVILREFAQPVLPEAVDS